MAASKYTKKSYKSLWICRIIEFWILFAPLIIEVIICVCGDKPTSTQKVIVLGTSTIAFIIVLFNAIAQKHLRSPLWIIFLGLYATMDNLIPLIICVAIGCILDEFLLSPLIKYYKTQTVSNLAMDKRLPKEEPEVVE